MPDKVERRYGHSINAVGVRDDCVWVMVIGGWKRQSTSQPDITLLELSE